MVSREDEGDNKDEFGSVGDGEETCKNQHYIAHESQSNDVGRFASHTNLRDAKALFLSFSLLLIRMADRAAETNRFLIFLVRPPEPLYDGLS